MAPLAVRSAVVLNHAANLLAESSIHILEPRKGSGSSSSSGSRGSSRGGGGGVGGSGNSGGKKINITATVIAGIVIGVVVFLIILFYVIHMYWRRRNGHKTFADRFLRKKKDTEEVEPAAAEKVTMKQMVMPEDHPYKQQLVAEHEAKKKKKQAELDGTWGATDGDARTLRPSTETAH
ncbi:hypothetical protein BS50DRAFT_675613 [Corynespora cassiicola Philippines]|uniref:receptor protein-tyrosine kinase n=1 Tax=Corynespora cassiicola Philippines TaxID=1448308 RepID=A0A2T2NVM3_CORCC|nr:hypothetical protein BS50DRAFT_675613 [Corynespora cassiicola Philippines]